MPSAHVEFRLPDGSTATVPAAGIIGRMSTAQLRIFDPEVSEAHALVSLRGRRLKIISLRGPIKVDGKVVAEADLGVGQKIRLSSNSVLVVVNVALAASILALTGLGDTPEVLDHGVVSLLDGPRLESGIHREARVLFWSEADGWVARVEGGRPVQVLPGMVWQLGGGTVSVVLEDVARLPNTTRQTGLLPIHLLLETDLVTLQAAGRPALRLSGLQAALIEALAAADGSTHWEAIAAQFWRQKDQPQWRERFDALVKEVRAKFRDQGIRADLVWSWQGEYRLNLGATDVVERKP